MYTIHSDKSGIAVLHNGGILYDGCQDVREAELLVKAHEAGAETYLDACEIEPTLKDYWPPDAQISYTSVRGRDVAGYIYVYCDICDMLVKDCTCDERNYDEPDWSRGQNGIAF